MNQLASLNRITELMARFVAQVEGQGALGFTDLNRVAEDILVPLLRITYGYDDLKNLNSTDAQNFPAVDLGDHTAKVSIQVTSTSDSGKIKDTLETFVRNNQQDQFNRLRFYLLTGKQKSYQGKDWDAIIDKKFKFDKSKDILDYKDLLAAIGKLDLARIQRIEQILESFFGDGNPSLFEQKRPAYKESIHLNLLEINFSEHLLVAQLSQVVRSKGKSRKGSYEGQKVREFLIKRGMRFPRDWVCYAGQLLTFQDLNDEDNPLRSVIETESIEAVAPREFCSNSDRERVFKHLLDKCFSECIYSRRVAWQHEEKLYIFLPNEPDPDHMESDGLKGAKRTETWFGKKNSTRTVFEVTEQTKEGREGQTWYCKHLAFHTRYHRISEKWYVSIKPDWFFSFDGYNKFRFSAEKLKYLKTNEKNQHVYNHVRFIVYFLKTDRVLSLFEEPKIYPHLKFGDLLSFNDSPFLDDKVWVSGEMPEDLAVLKDAEAPSEKVSSDTTSF